MQAHATGGRGWEPCEEDQALNMADACRQGAQAFRSKPNPNGGD